MRERRPPDRPISPCMRPAKRPRSTVNLVVRDDRRDRRGEPHRGREQRLGDPRRDDRETGVVGGGDAGKAAHDPPHRPEQADERGRRAERGKKRQARFEAAQLGVQHQPHRPLDALAPLAGGLGRWPRRGRALGPARRQHTPGRVARLGLARCGHQFGRRMCGSGSRLMALRRPADRREPPQLVDDHRPAPHRGGEQQQKHALDDDVGMQEQADDRQGRHRIVHG